MALDEAIATCVRKGSSPQPEAVWLGQTFLSRTFQKTSDINISYYEANKIPIVRRPTGGRAILHDKELTYSFSVRTGEDFFKGLFEAIK
jgi:lipoate-protein ligase A